MLRSMFSGVSGLRSHQTMMDVIGNNIANVNTNGFKTSQVVFQDMLSQLLRGAGAPANGNGGTNPAQVGLGVRVGGITTNFSQGAVQLTGRSTDLSISGDGFFIVRQGGENLYTRAGSLSFDSSGQLVTQDGSIIQGWMANNGVVNTNAAVQDFVMPISQVLPPKPTANVGLGGNLPADNTVAPFSGPNQTVITSSITVYDTQGNAVPMTFQFTKTAADTWSIQPLAKDGPDADLLPDPIGAPQTLVFDPTTGAITTPAAPNTFSISAATLAAAGVANTGPLTVDLSAITQYGSQKTLSAESQDGFAMGSLQSFNIAQDGTVAGVFSNGLTRALGRIALASFTNPGGLEKAGGSNYRTTANSGLANVGDPGSGGRGFLAGGTLEMSNVDLAQEFTNLIVAQRGFQANSRVISASDELLQDLVNLKR
ncbi:MAG TPA: flagellar hook protein FlgE [Acidimicrobiales bacterium]|nr:flagellar hook protein FlgE [Acidimicrobiales bacterium]